MVIRILAGAVIGKAALVDQIEHGHQALGAVNSPFNSWLRYEVFVPCPFGWRISLKPSNGAVNCKRIRRISRLYHPFVGNQQQQALAEKYLTGYGSLFAIDLKDTDFERLKTFVNALTLVWWGQLGWL